MLIFKAVLISFLFSFLISLFFVRSHLKFGKKEKPCWGGFIIYLSILFMVILLYPNLNTNIWYLLIPYSLMFVIGIIDDLLELSPFWKFISETIPVFIAIFFGIRTNIIYFPNYLNIFFTFLWLMIIINAINMLDIKDGLALGVITISLVFFLILGIVKQDILNTSLVAVFLGASLGFFPFNFPKAKVYLGDSGSLPFGFFLGAIAVNFSYAKEVNPFALITPIVILGLPLFDFGYVTLRRLIKRKSIFRKSRDHLALLMEKANFSRIKIIFILWTLCFLFGLSAMIIQFAPFKIGIISFLFVFLIWLTIGIKFSKL